MAKQDLPKSETSKTTIEADAKGQYAGTQHGGSNNGVASAKPSVITGSDDATLNRTPPGQKPKKDWDINYDPKEMNEGDFRG